MKEARSRRYFRHPRTTQERRLACDPDHKPYVRAKRNKRNLPDDWADISISKKRDRKKKFKNSSKKYTYEVVFECYAQEYYIKEFFEQIGIRANFEEKREKYIKTIISFKSEKDIGFDIVLDTMNNIPGLRGIL